MTYSRNTTGTIPLNIAPWVEYPKEKVRQIAAVEKLTNLQRLY